MGEQLYHLAESVTQHNTSQLYHLHRATSKMVLYPRAHSHDVL